MKIDFFIYFERRKIKLESKLMKTVIESFLLKIENV